MPLVYLYKRKNSKSWYLAYAKHLHKPNRSLRTHDKALAQLIRSKEENNILLGLHGIKQGPVHKIPFSKFALLFLQHKQAINRAPNTTDSYKYALDNFGAFLANDLYVHKITIRQIEEFASHRRQLKRKEKTIRNELITLSTAFKWGMLPAQSFLSENPCKDMELPKKQKSHRPYLHPNQYLLLKKAIGDKLFRLIVDFYTLTLCRAGEGTLIRKSQHVDLENRLLVIPVPKTNTTKFFPITDQLLPVIKGLLRHSNGSETLIPFRPDTLNRKFKRYVKKAGLPENLTFHSLRHTGATWLAKTAPPLGSLQKALSHEDPQSTLIYVHTANEELRPVLNKLKLPTNKRRK